MRGSHFVETKSLSQNPCRGIWRPRKSAQPGSLGTCSKSKRFKRVWSLPQVCATLLAIQFTWASGVTTFCAQAHPTHESDRCAPDYSHEQSIVISDKKLSAGEKSQAASTVDVEGTLQPLANISAVEPDLADPLQVALVPTLAEAASAANRAAKKTPEKSADPVGAEKNSPEQSSLSADEPLAPLAIAKIEAASFHGITPGISNRINVLRTWGDPRSDDTQADELKYRFDNLPAVYVRFDGKQVESILVQLASPTQTSTLARKLNLQRLRPVILTDEEGTPIAQLYPERGVVLRYASQELGLVIASDESNIHARPRIGSILIQSILAEPFLLRAEASAKKNFTHAIADLKAALRLDRDLSTARAQLSEIHLKIGKAVTAERYAAEAVELEPQNGPFRLQWAQCLRQLARYNRAVEELRQVLEMPAIAPLLRAQVLNEMGMLASLGSQKVARRAMPLHTQAIKIADGLAVGDDLSVCLSAKQLLVEAHLAIAVEISVGDWQQKNKSVPPWIERASALAEALIAEDHAFLPLRLQVAVSSLAAVGNLETPINPQLWIEEAEETVAQIKADIADPLAASQFDWQLGLAYFHGSQIEHRRSKSASAIHLGELAEQQLAELAKERDLTRPICWAGSISRSVRSTPSTTKIMSPLASGTTRRSIACSTRCLSRRSLRLSSMATRW